MVTRTGYTMGTGRDPEHFTTAPHTMAATTTTLPAGVEFNLSTNAYWVRADYFLIRVRGGWELTDCINGEDRLFRSKAAGIAALAALV